MAFENQNCFDQNGDLNGMVQNTQMAQMEQMTQETQCSKCLKHADDVAADADFPAACFRLSKTRRWVARIYLTDIAPDYILFSALFTHILTSY